MNSSLLHTYYVSYSDTGIQRRKHNSVLDTHTHTKKKPMPSDTDVQNIDNCIFFYFTVCLFEVPIHTISEISPPFNLLSNRLLITSKDLMYQGSELDEQRNSGFFINILPAPCTPGILIPMGPSRLWSRILQVLCSHIWFQHLRLFSSVSPFPSSLELIVKQPPASVLSSFLAI